MAEHEVILVVHEGNGLASKDPNGLSDPYVKLEVRGLDGQVLLKKETKVQRKTLNPVWNERFFLKAPLDVRVALQCYDWDRVGDHDFMGHASVSLRELRGGEKQLVLEAKGKEEVKGTIRISASFAEGAGGTGNMRKTGGSSIGGSHGAIELSSLAADAMGMLAVHRAAYAGDLAALQGELSASLLRATCRLSGWTALEYAVHGEAEEATRLLLGRMAALPPAAAAPRALLLARTESIALLLLKAGYDPGQTVGALRETPLQRACRAGAVGVAKVLLEAGAEADAADACRRTALFYAVRAGNLELIQLLLARKVAWSELLEAALKELVAQKPSVGADARAALKRAGLITA